MRLTLLRGLRSGLTRMSQGDRASATSGSRGRKPDPSTSSRSPRAGTEGRFHPIRLSGRLRALADDHSPDYRITRLEPRDPVLRAAQEVAVEHDEVAQFAHLDRALPALVEGQVGRVAGHH